MIGVNSCLDLYSHASIIGLFLIYLISEKVSFKRCLLVCQGVGWGELASCSPCKGQMNSLGGLPGGLGVGENYVLTHLYMSK